MLALYLSERLIPQLRGMPFEPKMRQEIEGLNGLQLDDVPATLGPEPSLGSFHPCWTHVGFSLQVEK
jgi:hypothetical protein